MSESKKTQTSPPQTSLGEVPDRSRGVGETHEKPRTEPGGGHSTHGAPEPPEWPPKG
jgi:hypothetical protein